MVIFIFCKVRHYCMSHLQEIASLRAKLKDTSFKLKQYEAKVCKVSEFFNLSLPKLVSAEPLT